MKERGLCIPEIIKRYLKWDGVAVDVCDFSDIHQPFSSGETLN